mmetsp:Transcript_60358/g.186874  ORF Transcript_60358/g.186874 Transcript_60358/m.186874 type:complete len:206 (+) Transcript_60358:42-659(+)
MHATLPQSQGALLHRSWPSSRSSRSASNDACVRSISCTLRTANNVPTTSLFLGSPRICRRPVISSSSCRPPLQSASRVSKSPARSGGMSSSSMSRCTLLSWMVLRNSSFEMGVEASAISSKMEKLMPSRNSALSKSQVECPASTRWAARNFFSSWRASRAMRTLSRSRCARLFSPSVFAAFSVFSMYTATMRLKRPKQTKTMLAK